MANIRPIPRHIEKLIKKVDLTSYPKQDGVTRFYAYLTTIKKELVKITVAVRNYKKQWYIKQVAVHGADSETSYVKDMEKFILGGYKVGWTPEGIPGRSRYSYYYNSYDDGKWYETYKWQYFNPFAPIVNVEFVDKLNDYKYSAYKLYHGGDLIHYLRTYRRYPQAEMLMKLGLHSIAESKTILKKVAKSKDFRKWLVSNKEYIQNHHCYTQSILSAYKWKTDIASVQNHREAVYRLNADKMFAKRVSELFGSKDKFLEYITKQNTNVSEYEDYLQACDFLNVDLTDTKNFKPLEFKRWHDIRANEFKSAKAKMDEVKRKELYENFLIVANKYKGLQRYSGTYVVIIAKSPAELIEEGDTLHHCVGKMGYDAKFASEKSLIFFVRNKGNPSVPFVTMEYSITNKQILQCYGDHDSTPQKEVLDYVKEKWLPYANNQLKKIKEVA